LLSLTSCCSFLHRKPPVLRIVLKHRRESRRHHRHPFPLGGDSVRDNARFGVPGRYIARTDFRVCKPCVLYGRVNDNWRVLDFFANDTHPTGTTAVDRSSALACQSGTATATPAHLVFDSIPARPRAPRSRIIGTGKSHRAQELPAAIARFCDAPPRIGLEALSEFSGQQHGDHSAPASVVAFKTLNLLIVAPLEDVFF